MSLALTSCNPSMDDATASRDYNMVLYNVGVIASVIDLVSSDDGTMKLIVKALERASANLPAEQDGALGGTLSFCRHASLPRPLGWRRP